MRRIAAIGGSIALLDQLTKEWVVRSIHPERPVEVIAGFFRLVNWGNTGAAWGMFSGGNLWLAILSLAVLVLMIVFRKAFGFDRPGNQVAFGLISGGIVGNVIDRFRHGHVVDFLDFSLRGYHWPAFNVADSAICVGVGIYLVLSWRAEKSAAASAQSA